ncbi:MAG: hypothetical protein ACD_81C00140G0002 [uncultured bacterium]|uniref:DUF11 domain-containing protein n=2 Tax=Candidatus Wolfeibacteriota TaxID=1752735 RepID=A0A0G1H773_9BACT|nr:MAG: hypothetical protein ACD_81C00140G0002 [uncultured bacterium]KKR12318.1 MAG: hypothetical protein UT41_C0002G0092 [Candidatus Wolfebacteria bacterium GW2011_GWC2_39_22]KKT43226.1 MAG: hypothetical protein UW32_C0002G0087 [Candidatus Wolfebacteria bacterium GW2011_GWE2_44_13]HBI25948.1 hypothetical protein [Candidatus Wolfebacteria bacterium]
MSLEELEKKLYGVDRKEESGERPVEAHVPKQEATEVQTGWNAEAASGEIQPKGKAVKMTVIGVVLALLVIGGVSYYYISEFYKTKDLLFEAETVENILIARPFDVTVNVENRSRTRLRDAKIFVTLPDGVISTDTAMNRQTIEESVGDLNAGEMIERTYSVIVVKDEQSTKKMDVNFSYLPENINTRFEREETLEVRVGQPAITLDFTTPQNVFSTENFDIGMRYRNISDIDFRNVQVRLIVPPKVSIKSASVKATTGDATWNVDILKPQEERAIAVKGAFEGANQEFFELKSQVVVMINGQEYIIGEKTANLGIAASPLSLAITANNRTDYVANLGEAITYTLTYRNNTDVGLSDVIIKAKLKGELFDMVSVRSEGGFDSRTNTLTWNTAGIPALKLIGPGVEGSVEFTIQTKKVFPIKRMFDKNYVLQVAGEINSPTVPYNVASDKTVGFADSETKVAGNITIDTKIALASGSAAPQVNKPSKYLVTWTIRNYATDMRDIKINSSLQPGIVWTGVAKGSNGSVPTYNDRTGEIAWAIEKIVATKGVIGAPTEATFQVEITPNITQIGGSIEVTKDGIMTAVDDFTGMSVTRQVKGLLAPGASR